MLPALPPHAQRLYREAASPTRPSASPASADSASTCIANAGGPRPRFGCCRRACRGSRASASRPVELLAQLPRGLVLIGGATGSGKTTTLAALVDEINRRDAKHIVTIEDPIEYEHHHHNSVIEQVEIGVDAPDFPTALRAAMRQAPDVIVVGEMRDPETMRIALAAAETGHLVFSTLHTTDVASTVSRIADSFPPSGRTRSGRSWRWRSSAVLPRRCCPRQGAGGCRRRSCWSSGTARGSISAETRSITCTGDHDHAARAGRSRLEESLARLVKEGQVDWRDAQARAVHTEEFEQLAPNLGA